MPLHKLCNNILLNLPSRRGSIFLNPQPRLFNPILQILSFRCFFFRTRDENDLEFTPMQLVPNDNLVSVPFESGTRFGDENR